ncbi:MAG: ribbon-helix-helix protein, CopG family [Oscillospiraceae bacterium]|nr:ribbon-helix-helix protein, CopG family [Oscillospiraceae bacterium]
MSPKMGRPTDNPKPYKITVRIDEKNKEILDKYCKQEEVSQMEAVRRGIKKLENDIKK